MNRLLVKRAVVQVAAAALVIAGIGLAASPVSASAKVNPAHARTTHIRPATSTNIDLWFGGLPNCYSVQLGWWYCLWYSPGGTGAIWGSTNKNTGTITGRFEFGGAGNGKAVRNNAASMGNPTGNCNVTTWVSPNYSGAFNWLDPEWDGNLTSNLRNNEASISANHCT
jgi:hypothetical protein